MTEAKTFARARRAGALAAACVLTAAADLQGEWRRHTIDDTSRGADGIRLGDLNGDGRPDLATGWEEGGVIRVYLNPGPADARHPWPKATVAHVASPEDAVFADLNQDGALDVISSCEGRARSVFIHWGARNERGPRLNDGWPGGAVPALQGKQSWMFALPWPRANGRSIDLFVGAKGKNASIGWLKAPSDPANLAAWRYTRLYNAGWIMTLKAADVDGDGDLDVLASDRRPPTAGVLWLENPGAAPDKRPWAVRRIGLDGSEVMFIDAADVNGDKRPDMVAAVKPNRLAILFSKPPLSWALTALIPLPADAGSAKSARFGDIDGDGQVDVAYTCEHALGDKHGVGWLKFEDEHFGGTPERHIISGSRGVKFDRSELIDLDDDGDLDLVTCEEAENLGVIWYENPSRRPSPSLRGP